MKKNIFLAIGLLSAGIVSAESPSEKAGKIFNEVTTAVTEGLQTAGKGVISGLVAANEALDKFSEKAGEKIVKGIQHTEEFAGKVADKAREVGAEVGADLAQDRIIKLANDRDAALAAEAAANAALEATKAALKSTQGALSDKTDVLSVTEAALRAAKDGLGKKTDALDAAKLAAEAAQTALAERTSALDAAQTALEAAQAALAEKTAAESVTWKDSTMTQLGNVKDSVVGGLASVYDFTTALPSNIASGTSSAWNASVNGVSSVSASGMEKLTTTWNKGKSEKAAIIAAGVVVTAATTYGLYRLATSAKAKSFYSWIGSKFSSKKS